MKHFTQLKNCMLLALMLVMMFAANAQQQLYFSEILFNKDGDESTYQFIEIRGTPNLVIDDFTYIGVVEGDNESGDAGKIKWWFDISGVTIGSNGYLVIRQKNSPYIVAPGATVITGTHTNTVDLTNNIKANNPSAGDETSAVFEGFIGLDGGASYKGSNTTVNDGMPDQTSLEKGDVESLSQNFLLINHTEALAVKAIYDSNKDGQPDASWTILDQVSTLDDDGTELGYGGLIFAQTTALTRLTQSGATIVENTFEVGYMARVGNTTGSTANDWFGAQIEENGAFVSIKNETIAEYADLILHTIGGPNFVVTYSAGQYSPTGIAPTLDLIVAESLTSAGDMEVYSLTVEVGQTLTIASGHTLTVNGNLTVDGSLVIESGASLITKDGNSIGAVTINRNTRFSNGSYSFVGSPVEFDQNITGAMLGSNVYWYDETQAYSATGGARWKDASAAALMPGQGYTQASQQLISFTGVPNDGEIVVPGLTHTAPDGNHDEHGWHLLSNPYPAAISAQAFIELSANSGLNAAIYLWDDKGIDGGQGTNSDYLTTNAIGAAAAGPNGGVFNGYIGSMQGFFVKVAAPGTTDATFTEAMRVGGSNADANFFRKADGAPLNIKLAIESKTKGFYNELLIGLRDDATIGVDRLYDADKLIGNTDLQFYSLINDNKYAIQGLPKTVDISTELAFNLGEASDLTLSVVELSGLADGITFLLTDKVTGKVYDLSAVSSFNFSAAKGSDQNRFTLTYGTAAVLSNSSPLDQPIYRFSNNVLNVNFGKALQVEGFMVYDLSGKTILSKSALSTTNELQIPISNKGISIIRIVTSEGTFTRKFLF